MIFNPASVIKTRYGLAEKRRTIIDFIAFPHSQNLPILWQVIFTISISQEFEEDTRTCSLRPFMTEQKSKRLFTPDWSGLYYLWRYYRYSTWCSFCCLNILKPFKPLFMSLFVSSCCCSGKEFNGGNC